MKKTDLVEVVSKMGQSKAVANDIVNAVFDAISDELAKGEKVTISGLGVFSVKQRNARTGVNPSTGAKIQIAARKAVGFKPSSTLKEAINA